MGKIIMHAPRVSYYYGGAERYILNLLIELSKRNYPVDLMTYDAPEKTEWFNNFIKKFSGKIYLLRSEKMDKNFNNFQKASIPSKWDRESMIFGKESKEFYKKNNFSAIISHYTVDCLYLPKDIPIILHLHGLPDKKRIKEEKAILLPKKIIAVSNYVGYGWRKLYNLEKKINIVPNGIFFNKIYNRKKKIDALYCGRLIKIKGVDIFIKALHHLERENIFLKTKIIGKGPEAKRLISLSENLNLQNIIFIDEANDNIMFKNLSLTKVSVFPSYKREGIMTSLLEASKYGSVIVASDSCSNREFIMNGVNGLLFKQKDYKDLSKCIKKALCDEELRRKLVSNSYKTLKKFTWEKQATKLIKIYS